MRVSNNKVSLIGTITEDLEFSHKSNGVSFYITKIEIARLSGVIDTIPLMFSEKIVDINEIIKGKYMQIFGSFRSYSSHDDEHRLLLSVYVSRFNFVNELSNKKENNLITLIGHTSKDVLFRETPLGRSISEIMLVSKRGNSSDLIPCIAWGRNAIFSGSLPRSTKLKVVGRIQSRDYSKKTSENEYELKTAYEVSVSKLEVISDAEQSN